MRKLRDMNIKDIRKYANKWVNNYTKDNREIKKSTWIKSIMILAIITLLTDIKYNIGVKT